MPDAAEALKSITPKKRTQFHQSFMSTLSVCQLRAMFRYQLGIRRPPAAYLHVGTAVDRSVGANLQTKIDTGELLKRSDAIGVAEATFDQVETKDPFELEPKDKREGKSKEQLKTDAKEKALDLDVHVRGEEGCIEVSLHEVA